MQCQRARLGQWQQAAGLGGSHTHHGFKLMSIRSSRMAPARAALTSPLPMEPETKEHKLIETFGFKPGFHYDFELGSMIGSGSFGVVHTATHIKSGRKYAVKTIPKHFFGHYIEEGFAARVQHEVDVLRHMGQSLNVIHLIEAYEDDVCVDLVMELAVGGSLMDRIKHRSYNEATAARIIADVLRAVAQCHAKGVIILDVKPENFLFLTPRDNAPLKMVDFGLADYLKPGQMLTERVGTPFYVAPEVLKQCYSFPADVWSAGVTAYQLLTGRFPWHADPDWVDARGASGSRSTGIGTSAVTNKALWRAIMYGQFDFTWAPWDKLPAGARDLVMSMLNRDPEQRPTAADLLHHPWLVSITSSIDESWESSTTTSSSSTTSSNSGGSVNGSRCSSPKPARPLADSLVQRLQRYGTYGRLKQLALRQVAMVMSADPSNLQGLGHDFEALDLGGAGKVPCSDVRALLSSGKYDLSDVEVRMLMSQFDLDRSGSVDYYEWLAALLDWGQAQSSPNWEGWLRQVFDSFDADGSGHITTSELWAVLGGESISELEGEEPYVLEDAVPAALRQADSNGDGKLSFEEFAALLRTDAGDELGLFASRRRRNQPVMAQ